MQPASRRALLAAALLAAPLACAPAAACTISMPAIGFGAYDPLAAGADNSMATLTLLCPTSVSAPVVALSAGSSGSFAARRMTNGPYLLTYNLYTTTARTVIWGDGTGGSVTVTLTTWTNSGGQRRFTRTIFGRAPALQNIGAGPYIDTITLTVTF